MAFLREDNRVRNTSFVRDSMPYVGALVPVPEDVGKSTTSFLKSLALAIYPPALAAEAISPGSTGLRTDDAEPSSPGSVVGGNIADRTGDSVQTGFFAPLFFQYFPESFTDSKESNIDTINLPAASNPSPTISGASERVISFTLQFSREKWKPNQGLPPRDWDKYNVDVAVAINAVRRFLYPVGVKSLGIKPRTLLLVMPGTRIGIFNDFVSCIMLGYSTTYQSFFPDGQPRLAEIEVRFLETQALLTLKGNIVESTFSNVYQSYVTNQHNFIQAKGLGIADFGGTKNTNVAKGI